VVFIWGHPGVGSVGHRGIFTGAHLGLANLLRLVNPSSVFVYNLTMEHCDYTDDSLQHAYAVGNVLLRTG